MSLRIKLQNSEGKVKFLTKPDDYPVIKGGIIRFKWHKKYVVVDIKTISTKANP